MTGGQPPESGAGTGKGAASGAIELPGHGSCYICGSENKSGLGITFRIFESGEPVE